jgi:hypothetical protein
MVPIYNRAYFMFGFKNKIKFEVVCPSWLKSVLNSPLVVQIQFQINQDKYSG